MGGRGVGMVRLVTSFVCAFHSLYRTMNAGNRLPRYVRDRLRKREGGVHVAKSFLTPHQTLGVFFGGGLIVLALVGVIIYKVLIT